MVFQETNEWLGFVDKLNIKIFIYINLIMLYFKFHDKPCKSVPPLRKKRRSPWGKLLDKLYKMLCANPDFDDKILYVAQWFVEYDEEYNESWREIGLDINKNIIVKMPDERNYGFWLDTNMKLENFKKEFDIQMITKEEFEDLWNSVYYDREVEKFKPFS